jgi:tetratricopeptide (TPR) repeat protein
MPSYVDARLLYEQGLYEQALPLFDEALKQAGEAALPQLHYFTADTLARLSRVAEAEHHYLEELAASPHDVRARSALAALYHRDGRIEEARQLTDDLVRITPTREAFSAASRLWTALGDPQAAAQARARARRTPADSVSQ